jgi:hypothetical protein
MCFNCGGFIISVNIRTSSVFETSALCELDTALCELETALCELDTALCELDTEPT